MKKSKNIIIGNDSDFMYVSADGGFGRKCRRNCKRNE